MKWYLPFLILALPGCATVNNSSVDYFRIDSVPQGAKVTTTLREPKSRARGKRNKTPEFRGCEPTPCAIKMPRRSEFIARIDIDGYQPAEIFITNSSKRGSFAGSMAMTSVTMGASTYATAAAAAAFSTAMSEFASLLVTGFANVFSGGAVPVGTQFATTTTTSSVLSSTVPPALAVTGGMMLLDAASGANLNLYPNPVVLKLAENGEEARTDPNVELFRTEITLLQQRNTACGENGAVNEATYKTCPALKRAYRDARKRRKDEIKARHERLAEALKAIQEAEAEAQKISTKTEAGAVPLAPENSDKN